MIFMIINIHQLNLQIFISTLRMKHESDSPQNNENGHVAFWSDTLPVSLADSVLLFMTGPGVVSLADSVLLYLTGPGVVSLAAQSAGEWRRHS